MLQLKEKKMNQSKQLRGLDFVAAQLLLATYLKIDSSSTLLTSPSRIKIGIRIFKPSASIYFWSGIETFSVNVSLQGSHSLATGKLHVLM